MTAEIQRLDEQRAQLPEAERTAVNAEIKAVAEHIARLEAIRQRATEPVVGDAPVFRDRAGNLAIVGVVSPSTGPKLTAGCGGLTGVTPLLRYRPWIPETARALSAALGPKHKQAPIQDLLVFLVLLA